jgi:hypothetical protein
MYTFDELQESFMYVKRAQTKKCKHISCLAVGLIACCVSNLSREIQVDCLKYKLRPSKPVRGVDCAKNALNSASEPIQKKMPQSKKGLY